VITINFQPVSLADKPLMDSFFKQQRYENSECNFANLFMWRQCFSTERAIEDDFLIIKGKTEQHTFILPPFGSNLDGLEKILNKAMDYFQQINLPFMMRSVPWRMVEIFEKIKPNYFSYQGDRDSYDYVYNTQDLIELKGRKYHRKRNHIHNFKKNYGHYEYLPLTEDLIRACRENTIEWCEKKGCEEDPSLLCEKCAVLDGLKNFTYLELQGGVIIIDGKIEAFTFGEPLNEDTAVIHVEKGNTEIKGIYPVINQEFCQHNWQGMKYINREEDLGLEGIRKAKESYYPVKMQEKYVVTLK